MSRVTRRGIGFTVEDAPTVASWNFWQLWADEGWEQPSFAELDRLLPEGGSLLDIGAWVGPYALWAAASKHAQVVAIEPDPEAIRQLLLNIEYNNLGKQIHVVPHAAGPAEGRLLLHSVREWGASTSSTTVDLGESMSVRCVSLPEVIRTLRPDLVKMDVEGGESYLIPAVEPMLYERGTPILFSTHWLQADISEAWKMLAARWTMTDIDNGGGEEFLCVPDWLGDLQPKEPE